MEECAPSLKHCVSSVLQLVLSVRFSEIINYPKIATHYFSLLELLFKSHVELVIELCDTAKFLALVSSLHEGLLSVQPTQQQSAAASIDSLMSRRCQLTKVVNARWHASCSAGGAFMVYCEGSHRSQIGVRAHADRRQPCAH